MGIFQNKIRPASSQDEQAGQILLIVVLATVISLTVGLSAVSRTITNTKVSTEEANSQKALSAAEAGIEKLLSTTNVAETGTLSNRSTFSANSDPINEDEFALNAGADITQDEGADVWLSDENFSGGSSRWSGNLRIGWMGGDCGGSEPAIEVTVLSGNRTNPTMERYVYDYCATQRANSFDSPGGGITIAGLSYNRSANISVTNGYIARIIPIYASTKIGARGPGLPTQGYVISSVGKSDNAKRQIKVFRGFPSIPIEFFPYNLFVP